MAGLWVIGVITAALGFYLSWGVLPGVAEIAVSIVLLAPVALPKSFGDILGITHVSSTRDTWLMAVFYWSVVVALHWLTFKTKSLIFLLIVGGIVLISSINWLNVGTSMIGL